MAETQDGQMILEEEVDENYDPTEQEVFEYAQWLGMDVDREKVRSDASQRPARCADANADNMRWQDLLWIAKEGLKAPLPTSWKPW
jgi:centrosomal protein CEP164